MKKEEAGIPLERKAPGQMANLRKDESRQPLWCLNRQGVYLETYRVIKLKLAETHCAPQSKRQPENQHKPRALLCARHGSTSPAFTTMQVTDEDTAAQKDEVIRQG